MTLAAGEAAYAAAIKAAFLAGKAEIDPANFDAIMTTLSNLIASGGKTFVQTGQVNTLGLADTAGDTLAANTTIT